ncbi:MAG: hypothetical protein RBR69_04760 [Candidatus Cloacimonadaceae bacterium]|jgi:hypothetical protein|nr:hypothetical protein [Candidatus Cloacimonadota bacterium]MDY0127419.1 hypothetical protein [Candidatus Cloacimonadaceae bacterium]MCB5255524.1 hypothetical protein [Candidatus Cloacimonadota bacterium]MCK9178747.1 hypothetical protein [Candidatus Cloacimonadota bacterium]MCK9243060.1 hypothetical protein [Candidatus Cloacimonadota bacterium]
MLKTDHDSDYVNDHEKGIEPQVPGLKRPGESLGWIEAACGTALKSAAYSLSKR